MKFVLSIAGSDSCGGAGIQADIKTITRLGGHALTVVTAVTAQNSLGITAIHTVPSRIVSRQIETLLDDIKPHAVKIGMLSTAAVIKSVVALIKRYGFSGIVVDPVLRASTGKELLAPGAFALFKASLIPLAGVVTPNIDEAEILAGRTVRNLAEMKEAAKIIKGMGPDVVITGGHMKRQCRDLLYDGKSFHQFGGAKIKSRHTHGTGCVYSAALATFLSMGRCLSHAAESAHAFTRQALEHGYACGKGPGPVNPL